MKYRKKPVVIEATRWFRNGDHPLDYDSGQEAFQNGRLVSVSKKHRRAHNWEGEVVGYYRNPEVSGERECNQCGKVMHEHGWIDTLEGGHIVCPGDWIITGVAGEHYPCKPDIFEMTYEKEENMTARPLTFGEKAVGLTFNPSNDPTVDAIKRKCADLIDEIDKLRTNQPDPDVLLMATGAITEIQTGQMWAVRAATWKHED